jgi:hypothetical protein
MKIFGIAVKIRRLVDIFHPIINVTHMRLLIDCGRRIAIALDHYKRIASRQCYRSHGADERSPVCEFISGKSLPQRQTKTDNAHYQYAVSHFLSPPS